MAPTLTTIIGVMVTLLVISSKTRAVSSKACEGLTSYQLQLNAFWSKETFYRQYPTYRPHAQWSRLIGRTHNGRYSIWSEGNMASEALREFTEQGVSTGFDIEPQGSKGIFDAFIGPNVATGVGSSSLKFLAHSNYNKLSFVVRIIPSPDWFIGVDSLDLCTNGEWISEKMLDLRPMDSGTDKGFSFTSPNWPEEPHKAIYPMTSTFPNHPASSFYYPEWSNLPPIAQLKLSRVDSLWIDEPEIAQNSSPEKHSATSDSPASHPSNSRVSSKTSYKAKKKFSPAENKAAVVIGKSIIGSGLEHNSQNTSESSQSVAKSVVRRKYTGASRSRFLKNGRNPSIESKVTPVETGSP